MAQFYTLDEAAAKLALPADDFKRRLKTESMFQNLRPFRDGTTLRFRSADIDELARSLGAASDPGLALGEGSGSGDFETLAAPKPNTPADPPLLVTGDDDIFGLGVKGRKGDSDSDVRLDLATPRAYDPNALNPTEEIDLAGPSSAVIKSSGLSGKTPKSGTKLGSDAPKTPSIGKTTGDDSSSEFELSLDPADDSFDFQLAKAAGDSSDEVDLSGAGLPAENRGGLSGINLAKPSDSGVSLEKKGPKTGPLKKVAATDDSDIDFELSLDPVGPAPAGAGGRNAKRPAPDADSDSEFELTLDDNSGIMDSIGQQVAPAKGGKGKPVSAGSDIIETDFELPAMGDESDSSDFELTASADDSDVAEAVELVEDEGGVVAGLDAFDESEPAVSPSGRRGGRNLLDDELDDGPSASAAMRGYDRGGDYAGVAPAEQVTVVEKQAPWGPLPAIVLLLCLPLVFLGTLMSFEAVRGMMGYQTGSGPGSTLVRAIAGQLGEKISD